MVAAKLLSYNLNFIIMTSNWFKYTMYLIFFAFILTSCENSVSLEEAEEYADNRTSKLAIETRSGQGGCFELIFPVDIEYPDGAVESYDTKEEIREAIKDWRLENPGNAQKPSLSFPVELLTQDGELVTVEDRKELRSFVRECRKENGHIKPCFRLIYPITILFPDGTSEVVEGRRAVKKAVRAWKVENPDATERPSIEFPITIQFDDGSTQEISSKEELLEAKDLCE
jgi:hypothetical protein